MLDFMWNIIFLGFVIGIPYCYVKKDIKFSIFIAYVLAAIVSLNLFYIQYGNNGIITSLIFAAQFFVFNIDGQEIMKMLDIVKDSVSLSYIVCLWTAFLVCPTLTIGTIIAILRKGYYKLNIITTFFKNIYIFTERNNSTILLAKDILKKNKNAKVVFAFDGVKIDSVDALNVSLSAYKVFSLFNKTNNICVCFSDLEAGVLLNKLTDFTNNNFKRKVEINVFSNNPIVYDVVDGIKKDLENVVIKVISTNSILIRNILWDYPLITNMNKDNEINVSVLGVGEFGACFAMNTLWCATLPDRELKLNLVDIDEEKNILRRVSEYIPENYFDIQVFNENVNTGKFFKDIESNRIFDSDYIMIATGNDDVNISVARKLRIFFNRKRKHPSIMVVIKNKSKYNVMKEVLKGENIFVTGGEDVICSYDNIFNDRFFNRAFKVYEIYLNSSGKTASVEDFYKQSQIDILSSYATSIHAKYKVHALCGHFHPDKKDLEEKISQNISKLSLVEHERWMRFEMLKGYIGVKKDNLNEFLEYNIGKSKKPQKNVDLKIHACITDNDGLDELSEILKQKTGENYDFVENDRQIALNTANIWFLKEEEVVYTPKPEDTSEIMLSKDIIELTEKIAKNTHENWSKNKLGDGWVYGKELDYNKKTHPCLVEYEELSEQDKEYDRTTAMEAIKFLTKLGYKIKK